MQCWTSVYRAPAVFAAAAVLCSGAWMAVNVEGNYGGHISGLFYTGSKSAMPADLAGERTYRVKDDIGYDGQFYHLIAHDPLIRRGFASFVDNPPLRWRRIGVPGLAALLAAGNDRAVDAMYVSTQLVFVFLGAFWLAQYAQSRQRHAAWGLAFLLIPAVLVSLDRMTVDLALAALTIGLVRYGTGRPRWPVYAILCAAPLVRETGLVLVVGWCLYAALERRWRAAMIGAGCAAPVLAWWTYVSRHTAPDGTRWLSRYPFSGIVDRTIHGVPAAVSTRGLHAASILEEVALAGIWLALFLSLYLTWKRRCGLLEVVAVLFLAFAAALGKFDIWESAYAAGRTMSPLVIVLGLLALRDRRPGFAIPLLLILPRIALQYEAELRGALRGWL
jgi:hypothetical protein